MQANFRYFLAFIILMLLLHELHELAHYAAGPIFCGCWGSRDFVYWWLCEDCDKEKAFPFVSLAGPFVTYIFMWTGFFLMQKKNTQAQKMFGYSLVFACLPLPKLVALFSRGGDELAAMRKIFAGHEFFKGEGVIVGALIVLAFTLPPLWRAVTLHKNKIGWIVSAALLIFAPLLDKLIVQNELNDLLIRGMNPVFIWIWDGMLFIAFLLTKKYLTKS